MKTIEKNKKAEVTGKIKVTMVQSIAGRDKRTKLALASLGLKKISSSRVFNANPSILGTVKKYSYLFKVENV